MHNEAQRILDAFDGVSPESRETLSEALRAEGVPFLVNLGLALAWPPKLAALVVDGALGAARWDGSAAILDRLGDSEPWATVRDALAEALEHPEVAEAIAGDER